MLASKDYGIATSLLCGVALAVALGNLDEAAPEPKPQPSRDGTPSPLLHLLGHDHETDAEAEEMEAIERRALARLAIPDPYA